MTVLHALDKIWRALKRRVAMETRSGSDAEFLGWQKTTRGEDIALFNVTAKQHRLYRSTVSEKTLLREELEVPPTPHRQRELRRTDDEE